MTVISLTKEEAQEILASMEDLREAADAWDLNQSKAELIERNQMPQMYYTLKERLGIPRDEVVTRE